MVNFKYNNGDLLRDKVTGLEGIVMVRAEYSTGCHHYGLQSPRIVSEGVPEWQWLDQSRLELVESKKIKFNIPKNTTSGPFPSGPSM